MHLVQGQSEQLPWHYCPFTKTSSPKVSCITFSYSKGVTSKSSLWEDRFEFTEHVTEDQTELGKVPPVMRRLIEQLFLAFLEQFDSLLALSLKILYEYLEVLVTV